jgi:RNA binding exosome subunit
MSLHSVTWRINASAIDNIDLLEDSLKWITGENSLVEIIKDKSFHGAKQYSVIAKTQKRKESIDSLKKIGVENLSRILEEGIGKRIDESKNLHIRLELNKLVSGEVCLASKNKTTATAKGKFKIESYPGETAGEVITVLIESIIKDMKN